MKYFDYMKNKGSTFESTIKAGLIAILLGTGVVMAQFSEPTASPTGNNTDAIHVGSGKQIKAGGFWARSLATDSSGGKLCLDKNGLFDDTNCITNWSDTPNIPKCRVESSQVISAGFMPNLTTASCDNMLSAASRSNGWTSTGSNHSTIVASSDGFPPSVCVFMRLVCTGLSVGPATSTVATTWPVANFTKSTNKCSDGINNDPITWNFVSNPSPQPAAYGRAMTLSDSMNYVSVSGDGGGYYTYLYKRAGAGSDTFNQLTTGLGRGFSAEPYTRNAVFANNDQFLIVGSWDAASNYLKIYENIGDNFTKLVPNATQGPSVQPPSWVNDVDVFQEGSNIYLAVTHIGGNRISIYKRTSTNPKLFTLLPSALNSYPSIAGTYGMGVDFSTDGNYIAVTSTLSGSNPIVTVYKRTGAGADTWNKLISPNGPDAQPSNQGEGVAFSNDGTYLAVLHHGVSPDFVATIYKKNGDKFERLSSPNGLNASPTSYPLNSLSNSYIGIVSPSFSPDGNYLAFADYSASAAQGSIKIYERSGDSFSKMPNSSYAITAVHSAQFSSDSQRLLTSFAYLNGAAQKYIALLQLSGDNTTDYPADPECGSWWDNTEDAVEVTVACSDSLDNDGDGRIDYASDLSGDGGCTSAADATE